MVLSRWLLLSLCESSSRTGGGTDHRPTRQGSTRQRLMHRDVQERVKNSRAWNLSSSRSLHGVTDLPCTAPSPEYSRHTCGHFTTQARLPSVHTAFARAPPHPATHRFASSALALASAYLRTAWLPLSIRGRSTCEEYSTNAGPRWRERARPPDATTRGACSSQSRPREWTGWGAKPRCRARLVSHLPTLSLAHLFAAPRFRPRAQRDGWPRGIAAVPAPAAGHGGHLRDPRVKAFLVRANDFAGVRRDSRLTPSCWHRVDRLETRLGSSIQAFFINRSAPITVRELPPSATSALCSIVLTFSRLALARVLLSADSVFAWQRRGLEHDLPLFQGVLEGGGCEHPRVRLHRLW